MLFYFNGMQLVTTVKDVYVCDKGIHNKYVELIRWLRDKEALNLIKQCEPIKNYVKGTFKWFYIVDIPKDKVVARVRGRVVEFYHLL
ncbi:MAG: hypothetical protein DRH17_13660 [Deltaproteobacteria bacterium]|nr:MAG: hypothetical protein DRH17_13660 [Deltaproteobacteria bacterium]